MVDPISSVSSRPYIGTSYTYSDSVPEQKKANSAAAEASSLYYATTLQSLQPALSAKKEEKSFLTGCIDWVKSLFGWGSPTTAVSEEKNSVSAIKPLGAIPQLPPADKRLAEAVSTLHRELAQQLKESADFEEELQKASSARMDKLVFVHLFKSSLLQRELKQGINLQAYDEIMERQQKNKDLRQATYAVIDEINRRAKTDSVLKWINIGTTGGTIASLALSFAIGGATGGIGVLAVATPLLGIAKGSLTLSQGILKYQNDLETGKLYSLNHESKRNSTVIKDELQTMQMGDEEIASLLKAIRELIDNQSEAERIFRPSK